MSCLVKLWLPMSPEINISSSSGEDYSDSVQIEHCYVNERPNKWLKPTPQSTKIVGEIENREGDVRPIRVLLDTRTSATIVLKHYIMQGSQRVSRNQKTKWTTMGGSFVTTQQHLLEFQFPEFHHHKTIEWTCHVDTKTDPKEAQYDMIVGTDLMNELGIDISFSKQKIIWAGATLPMRPRRILTSRKQLKYFYEMTMEATVLKEAEQ